MVYNGGKVRTRIPAYDLLIRVSRKGGEGMGAGGGAFFHFCEGGGG